MATVLEGHDKFRFLALQRLEIVFVSDNFIIFDTVIGNGSTANIEEIQVDEIGVGLKSTILCNLAYSDFVNIELLAINNTEEITEVSYQYKSKVGISDYNNEITHTGNIKATLQCKITDSDNSIMQIALTVIDSKRHISDVITAI